MSAQFSWSIIFAVAFCFAALLIWSVIGWKYNKFVVPRSCKESGTGNEIWIRSQFSCIPNKVLFIFRLCTAVFTVAVHIYIEIDWPLNISFYTSWTFTLLNMYFVLISIITIYIEDYTQRLLPRCMRIQPQDIHGNSNGNDHSNNNVHFTRLKFVCWIVYQLELCQSWFVFVIVWFVLYPSVDSEIKTVLVSWTSIVTHVYNVVAMSIDFVCNDIPLSYHLLGIFNVALPLLYLMYEFIWFEIVDWNHYFFMYTDSVINGVYYLVLFALQIIFWSTVWGCYRLKLRHFSSHNNNNKQQSQLQNNSSKGDSNTNTHTENMNNATENNNHGSNNSLNMKVIINHNDNSSSTRQTAADADDDGRTSTANASGTTRMTHNNSHSDSMNVGETTVMTKKDSGGNNVNDNHMEDYQAVR